MQKAKGHLDLWPIVGDLSFPLSMIGAHQVQNAASAVEVVSVLKKQGLLDASPATVRKGLGSAHLPGRFSLKKRSHPDIGTSPC